MFHIDPLFGRSICHPPWPKANPIVHPTSYPTHIPFIPSVSQTSHCWVKQFQYLPWKSKVKVMGEVKVWSHNVSHSIDSHPFRSMSIGHPIPEIRIFKIWPWKSKVKVMGEVDIESHNMGPTFYRLPSLSFHVNQPFHSYDNTFSKFDLKNPRSRSWVRGKLKFTTRVLHSIDSHPFHPMSIGHPIPEIRLFQNLTLKIQGQGHGWGQSWKSQSGCNILSTHIPFVPCQSALPFLRYSIFKIWPSKSMVKVKWSWCCTTTGLDNSIELQML